MDEEIKRKNILDLQFQRYLTTASTSVIITFTYFLGVGIAFFTKQVQLNDFIGMGAIFVISAGVVGTCSFLFFNSVFHLKNILKVIKEL